MRGRGRLYRGRWPKGWSSEVTSDLVPNCVFCIQIQCHSSKCTFWHWRTALFCLSSSHGLKSWAKENLNSFKLFLSHTLFKIAKWNCHNIDVFNNSLRWGKLYVGMTTISYASHWTPLSVSDHQCHVDDFYRFFTVVIIFIL